ncbi:MAG: glycosyltransferase family 4 protein [bacterium]|nr:glycosyltransferase family 4 protein [bacterium]
MRIALVSREYVGVGHGGGIGTYMRNTAAMLAAFGHQAEVFTVAENDLVEPPEGVSVHKVFGPRERFADNVLAPFLARHRAARFDVVEAREYGGDIKLILDKVPDLPRVVKLATAQYQIAAINEAYITVAAKVRFLAGGIRRGRIPRPYWGRYDPANDSEMRITLAADEVTSPSRALLDLTAKTWPIDAERAVVVPHVFTPDARLLALGPARHSGFVTFIGRLEVRKGVLELARAIPIVLEVYPEARFRFVGRVLPNPATGRPLDLDIRRLAGPMAADRIEFTGAVSNSCIPDFLSDTVVGVFPSYWEAFGFVCLEAMSAACGIVGSSAGGMAEIIEDGRTGLLVPPRAPKAIARAVVELLENPERRIAMGRAAREYVLTTYAPEVIAPLQEASYRRAIERAEQRQSTGGA